MAKKKVWPEDQIAVYQEMVPRLGLREASRQLNIPSNTLLYRCRQMGVVVPGREFVPPGLDEYIRIHGHERSHRQIAQHFGCSSEAVRKHFIKLGIESPQAEVKRLNRENLRVDYFDTWSREMAYDLGYVCADGCVQEEGLFLTCHSKDEMLVRGLRERLGSAHMLSHRIQIQKSGAETPKTECYVTSTKISQSLQNIGVRIRKSFEDHPMPVVPNTFFSDFVLGYFDGDGSVGHYEYEIQTVRCFQLLGQPTFISQVRERMIGLGLTPGCYDPEYCGTARVCWQGRDDLSRIYAFLYASNPPLYLERKKVKFEELLAQQEAA